MLDRIIYQGGRYADSVARWVIDNPLCALAVLMAALFAAIYWALRVSLAEKRIIRREW